MSATLTPPKTNARKEFNEIFGNSNLFKPVLSPEHFRRNSPERLVYVVMKSEYLHEDKDVVFTSAVAVFDDKVRMERAIAEFKRSSDPEKVFYEIKPLYLNRVIEQ